MASPQTGPVSWWESCPPWSKSWCEIFHKWQWGWDPWDETQPPIQSRWSTAETGGMKRRTRRPVTMQLHQCDQGEKVKGQRVPWHQPVASPSASSKQTGCDRWRRPQRRGMCRRSVRKTELGCYKYLLADWISAGCESAYRLGESHTGDRSVKYPHPDHMERVEAHRVPNTNVRSEQLNRQVREMKSDRGTVFH